MPPEAELDASAPFNPPRPVDPAMGLQPRPRVLVASNRLPVTVSVDEGRLRFEASSGGLATAMHARQESSGGCWVGWPGHAGAIATEHRRALEDELARRNAVAVELTSDEVSHYYDGFSNGVLWPLFHYLLDKVNLDAERDWRAFVAVNHKFADAIASAYRPGDLIWVHDYHLALVPALLRERIPDASIGFFLHVPFPAADVFRILPWRTEILRGLLGADLVGFHTEGYVQNFRQSVARVLGLESDGDGTLAASADRRVRTGAYPIGIDADAFARMAESADVAERVAALRAAAHGKRIVIGIDRLDYTKGVPRRLLAIDRLLTERPDLRDRLHFVQVAVPTRERVDAYADLRRTVNELVGRINAQHGSATGAPVHLLYRSVSFAELVALYRAADVMLVTPLRDGMNLVAKEFVASRTDADGVLVLSEFAGAAAELDNALLVNPYDIGAVASAVAHAIELPPGERSRRMQAMRTRVRQQDVAAWSQAFCDDLGAAAPSDTDASAKVGSGAAASGGGRRNLTDALGRVRAARARAFLLDYDGTLVGFAPAPHLAVPDDELRGLLVELAATVGNQVHIVSGRDRDSLDGWLGDLGVGLHAEHGFWSRLPGAPWRANADGPPAWYDSVLRIVDGLVARTPGALVEAKNASIAFHQRMVDPALALVRARELRQRLSALVDAPSFDVLAGSHVVEVRQRGVHKGIVVAQIADAIGGRGYGALLAAGDDLTDEDVFRALPEDAVGIKIGSGPSLARFQLAGPVELRACLRGFVAGRVRSG